ncbi:putative transcription factor bHLH147 [Cocos nucifera]|uniref:Putative transcription factor bHLH147 n=1 Tax=Cocos nucifera TaxID=13894 RepID=A0A8K0MU84_COCNU|nr:putative transcription factor bHLH147 [Cocos nucifera]
MAIISMHIWCSVYFWVTHPCSQKNYIRLLSLSQNLVSNQVLYLETKSLSLPHLGTKVLVPMVASLQSLLLAINSSGTTTRSVGANRLQTGSLVMKAMQRHAPRRRKQMARTERNIGGGGTAAWTRRQMMWKKKRVLLQGSRKPVSGIERRIRTLRRLLPNGESMGLEGLLHEAEDYIMCLQMQVKVMQIMVCVLSPKDSGV